MCARSIAGVPFDSVRRFRASLLLRTTCMHLCRNWLQAVWRNNKPKAQKKISSSAWGLTFLGDRNDGRVYQAVV